MRLWLTSLILLSLLSGLATAAPLVYRGEQTLWQDTVWQGEILVDGILTVAPGVTLEIRPGTVIRFTPFDSNRDGIGEHELFIQGTLLALGTATQPVLFTASGAAPFPGSWGALNLMASETGNRLEHVTVEYAYRGFHAHFASARLADCELRRCVRGAQFQESQVRMERCRLLDNGNGLQFRDAEVVLADLEVRGGYWGVRGVHSRVTMSDTLVSDNLINGVNLRDCDADLQRIDVSANRKGLYLQQSRASVSASRFADNREHGIFLEQSEVRIVQCRMTGNGRAGIKWLAATGTLDANHFEANGEYALVNDGPSPVAARANWWGTANAEHIAGLIRDHADLPAVGIVDYSDFLTTAPTL